MTAGHHAQRSPILGALGERETPSPWRCLAAEGVLVKRREMVGSIREF